MINGTQQIPPLGLLALPKSLSNNFPLHLIRGNGRRKCRIDCRLGRGDGRKISRLDLCLESDIECVRVGLESIESAQYNRGIAGGGDGASLFEERLSIRFANWTCWI
jgi:hypothetical protein